MINYKKVVDWIAVINLAIYQGKGRYSHMAACDLHSLQKVANLIIEGNLKKAFKIAGDVDTSVRDSIPTAIYDEISP